MPALGPVGPGSLDAPMPVEWVVCSLAASAACLLAARGLGWLVRRVARRPTPGEG